MQLAAIYQNSLRIRTKSPLKGFIQINRGTSVYFTLNKNETLISVEIDLYVDHNIRVYARLIQKVELVYLNLMIKAV